MGAHLSPDFKALSDCVPTPFGRIMAHLTLLSEVPGVLMWYYGGQSGPLFENLILFDYLALSSWLLMFTISLFSLSQYLPLGRDKNGCLVVLQRMGMFIYVIL